MMADKSLALAGASIVVGTTAFGTFLPPALDIRLTPTAGTMQDKCDSVRAGEIFATIATLVVCGIIARYDNSALPLVAGATAAAVMVGVYEWSLRGSH